MTSDHHPEAAEAARPRVVIAEDSVLLLAGLTKLLEGAGFEVTATAAEADGLLAAVERERPDVGNRRVLAVLRYLGAGPDGAGSP